MAKIRIHRTSRGTIAFRITYIVATLLAIGMIAFLLTVLWKFLEVYEISQPDTTINEFIHELENDQSIIYKSADITPNEFEDNNAVKEYLENATNGSITYSRNGKESNQEKNVYNIKVNDDKIAEVTITLDKNSELGFGRYKYTVSDFKTEKIPTHDYTVTAPDNVTLYCNGKEVAKSYVSEKESEFEELDNFHGLIENPPTNVTYTINGFINAPTFTANDAAGNQLELSDGKFSLAKQKNDELSQLALKFSQSYSKYIMNDARLSEVAAYLAPNMPLYAELDRYENFWHNWHTGYDFLNIKLGDPTFYTPDNVSVTVNYDHVLYGVQNSDNGELHTPADYIIYLVNLDGEWKVTELSLN